MLAHNRLQLVTSDYDVSGDRFAANTLVCLLLIFFFFKKHNNLLKALQRKCLRMPQPVSLREEVNSSSDFVKQNLQGIDRENFEPVSSCLRSKGEIALT